MGGAAAAVAVSVLTGVVGHAAQAGRTAGHPLVQDGATVTRFAGAAFDTCAAPARRVMEAWRASPFGAIGIYISGDQRGCRQEQLTAAWVSDVDAMGWRFLPLDVGLQAPCADNRRLRRMSSDASTAAAQGAAAAAEAVRAAAGLGLLPGSPLYSDLEGYDREDAVCGETVRAYVRGWTSRLHEAGYLAGVYGNFASGMRGLSDGYLSALHVRPDVVWNAHWDGRPTLTGWPGVPDEHWPAHQRIKQYRGDHYEVHGGLRVNIDSNIVDAPVARVARPII